MEFETYLFLFFLIIWSFGIQIILTLSATCYGEILRWVTFGVYASISILFCCIRIYKYRKNNSGILDNYNFNNLNNV